MNYLNILNPEIKFYFCNSLKEKIINVIKENEENMARARAGIGEKSVNDVYDKIAEEIIASLDEEY